MTGNGTHAPGPSPQQRLRELYERGIRLLLSGDAQGALQCFKDIYEVDSTFRDVAQMIEDSYTEIDWAAKHRNRIQGRGGE